MSDSYRYSSLVRSADYTLTAEGVAASSRRFGHFTRTLVPFDKIPVRSSTVSWSSKPLLWATIIFAVLFVVIVVDLFWDAHPEPAALALYGGLCALFASAYLLSRTTTEFFLFGDEHLSIFRRISTDPKLTCFLQKLQQRKLAFFKERITRRTTEVPAEEINRYLLHLRESDLVDEAGYDELKAHLEDCFADRTRIGFHKNA